MEDDKTLIIRAAITRKFIDTKPFSQFFGDSTTTRILDLLGVHFKCEYTIQNLEKILLIPASELEPNIELLVQQGLVDKTLKGYVFNGCSDLANNLKRFMDAFYRQKSKVLQYR